MELTGEKVINAPQARVYDALHDPVVLRQAIPGVQTLSKEADGRYLITGAVKFGPLRPSFTGTVEVYNEDRPAGYSLRGEARGGSAGSLNGNAHVALAAIDADTTNLAYHVTVDIDGKMADVDGVRMEVTARTLVTEFFSRLVLLLDGAPLPSAAADSIPAVAMRPSAATMPPPSASTATETRYRPDGDVRTDSRVPADYDSPSRSDLPITDATGAPQPTSPAVVASEPDTVRRAPQQTRVIAPAATYREERAEMRPPSQLPGGSYPQVGSGTLATAPASVGSRPSPTRADMTVAEGMTGFGRWFMVLAGIALIFILLNGDA